MTLMSMSRVPGLCNVFCNTTLLEYKSRPMLEASFPLAVQGYSLGCSLPGFSSVCPHASSNPSETEGKELGSSHV